MKNKYYFYQVVGRDNCCAPSRADLLGVGLTEFDLDAAWQVFLADGDVRMERSYFTLEPGSPSANECIQRWRKRIEDQIVLPAWVDTDPVQEMIDIAHRRAASLPSMPSPEMTMRDLT